MSFRTRDELTSRRDGDTLLPRGRETLNHLAVSVEKLDARIPAGVDPERMPDAPLGLRGH